MGALVRLLARLLALLWLLVLALGGLALLVYCVDGPADSLGLGPARPDRLLHLPRVREAVGDRLDALGAPGGVAVLGLLCGLGAVALGLALLFGLFSRRREPLLIVQDSETGVLGVRRRVAGKMLAEMVAEARGVSRVPSVRVRSRRHGRGGTARVKVWRPRSAEEADVQRRALEAAAPLTEPLGLRTEVRVLRDKRGGRVQ